MSGKVIDITPILEVLARNKVPMEGPIRVIHIIQMHEVSRDWLRGEWWTGEEQKAGIDSRGSALDQSVYTLLLGMICRSSTVPPDRIPLDWGQIPLQEYRSIRRLYVARDLEIDADTLNELACLYVDAEVERKTTLMYCVPQELDQLISQRKQR